MPNTDKKRITAKQIEGDVWLSRQTIKEILDYDIRVISSDYGAGEETEAIKKYIGYLIHRLDHLEI